MGYMFVKKDTVKQFMKSKEHRVAGDFAEHASKVLEMMFCQAIHRAKTNGRQTVMAQDL